MKKLTSIIFFICMITFCENTFASIIYFTGKISTLSATESSVALDGPDIVFEGLPNTGLCAVAGNRVHLIIKDDSRGRAQYSLALSAMISGKEVNIVINDLLRDSGNRC